jgi:cellobiose-specific phosphotransferase system component IIB
MASTDLITYLNYIATWETESDQNIDALIDEQNLFVKLDDFDSDDAINKEFTTLTDLAKEVRDLTIAEDATKMLADAAAVASIWTFGLGMAAFAALETSAAIESAVISSKSKDLNAKLTTVDTDISSKINGNVEAYVTKYKVNNNLIVSKAPKGMDTQSCRANLMQFMAKVQKGSGKLDAATFKKYAESARIVFESDEINKVYDALDELNLGAKSEADVTKFMNTLQGLQLPELATFGLSIVQGFSIAIMSYKLGIANKTIKSCAKAADIPLEEVDSSAFGMMDAVGKFSAGVAIVMSVVDVVLNIIDIVDIVKQTDKMCTELDTTIKTSYTDYFNGIKEASKKYNAAIMPVSTPKTEPVPA